MSAPAPARRVLFIAPFPPRTDGRHGGSRAVAHTILGVSARHPVALVCRRTDDDLPIDPALAARCALVEEVWAADQKRSKAGRARSLARHLVGAGRPRWMAAVHVEGFAERLHDVAKTFSPDVVQIEYHVMSQYLPALQDVDAARVLVAYEPATPAARERWEASRGLDRMRHRLDVRAWRQWEARILREVDLTVVFTERDRKAIAEMAPEATVRVVPVGTPLPPRPSDPLGSDSPNVLFVGNFAHPPNVDASVALARDILPQARRAIPELRAFFVGPDPPPAVRRLEDELTVVTEAVPEVTPYLERATVVVAPLWSGGGMRVKVLDALAAGKPVVATSRALEGLDVVDGQHVIVADTPAAFADALVALVGDPEQRASLARSARQWATSHLDPGTSARGYERVWEEALAKRATRP